MKKSVIILSLSLLASCGGGGGSRNFESAISGRWEGELIHGGIFCSDGTGALGGSGLTAGTIKLDVSGSDIIGSEVVVSDASCTYKGVREAHGFTAATIPTATCSIGYDLVFTLQDEDDVARVYYRFDFSRVPATHPDGQPVCAATLGADLYR